MKTAMSLDLPARLLVIAAVGGLSACQLGCGETVAPAVVLVSGEDFITGIAADGNSVYFIKKDGTLKSVSTDGGPVSELASGIVDPKEIAVDDTGVYLATSTGTIARVPKGGGEVLPLVEGEPDLREIAVSNKRVFFTTGTGGAVRSVATDGSAPETLATDDARPGPLALAGGFLYWATGTDESAIRRTTTAGGASETLVAGQALTGSIAADSIFLYWANLGSGTVARASVNGSDVREIAIDQPPLHKVLGDGTNVFWSSFDGSISVAPVDGSAEPFVMSTGPEGPTFLAQDDFYLYSARSNAGTIIMRPKPQSYYFE